MSEGRGWLDLPTRSVACHAVLDRVPYMYGIDTTFDMARWRWTARLR